MTSQSKNNQLMKESELEPATPLHHQADNIDNAIVVKAILHDENKTEALEWFYRLADYQDHEDFIASVTEDFRLELKHTDFDLAYSDQPTLLTEMGLLTDTTINKAVWLVLGLSDVELAILIDMPPSAFTPNADGEVDIKSILDAVAS